MTEDSKKLLVFFLRIKQSRIVLDTEDENMMVLRNVGIYLPVDTVKYNIKIYTIQSYTTLYFIRLYYIYYIILCILHIIL